MPTPWSTERVARVAVARHEAGGERGGPEAVPGPGEPDAGVGRVQARVEPADEQAHPGADEVGQGARARRACTWIHSPPVVARTRSTSKPAPASTSRERLRLPLGEEAAGEVASSSTLALAVTVPSS